MTTVAAIDCGTNSIRLLIAEAGPGGGLDDLDRRTEIVRLGQGVDATGEFHPDALARTFAAVEQYAGVDHGGRACRRTGSTSSPPRPPGTRRTATSSSTACSERLGVQPDVITGDARGPALLLRRARAGSGPKASPCW